jgi:hypothetical protein
MRTARPLGLSPDGRSLIVVVDGEQLAIPADDRLRAALRNDRARMGQLEIEMESALRPRDIQARIRAGESLEAVAQAAGVPMAQIEPFAAPVIAEREHIAGLAQSNPVRRAGDAVAHRSLRAVVSDRLLSRGIDADAVDWDAWRSGERRWTVRLSYESGSAHRQADFSYDQTGRFSVAANEDARWLTGEHSSSHGPQPGRRRRADEPSDERTLDDNDELAIVRAIQPQFEVTPDIDDDDELDTPDNEDAYAEGDLAEVDGVYDIIPGDRSNMDVLYDMLSTFDEDSVQIYAGLVRPAPDEDAAPVVDPGEAVVVVETVEVLELELELELDADDLDDESDENDEGEATEALTEPLPSGVDEAAAEEAAGDEDAIFAEAQIVRSPTADEPPQEEFEAEGEAQPADVTVVADEPAAAEPAVAEPAAAEPEPAPTPARPTGRKRTPAAAPITEPEQPSLVDEAGSEPSRPIKRKRASVPSWDEIMFGAPAPKPKD